MSQQPITKASAIEPTASEVAAVRELVSEALRYYADRHPKPKTAAGLTAGDLASNVQGWTHTTRLRGFLTTAQLRRRMATTNGGRR